jgi:hypothetical protein
VAVTVLSRPIGNDLPTVAGVALILGLTHGIGLAFVRDHLDDGIRRRRSHGPTVAREAPSDRQAVWVRSGFRGVRRTRRGAVVHGELTRASELRPSGQRGGVRGI